MPSDINPLASVAASSEWIEALSLVFQRLEEGERARRVAAAVINVRNNPRSLDSLFVVRGQQIEAAAWAQVMPGKTSLVWGPELHQNATATHADFLCRTVLDDLERRQIRLAQAICSQPLSEHAASLKQLGFTSEIELIYLACPLANVPQFTLPAELEFISCNGVAEDRLASLIEATYEGTCDAPGLNGVRPMTEVLEGYRHAGDFNPSQWWIVTSNQADVGCLLLNDHPMMQQFELVYMGLVPAARGNGWGRLIVRFAKFQSARCQRRRLLLAVDAQNDPAMRVYAEEGFYEIDRRTVLMKIFKSGGFWQPNRNPTR